MSLLCEQINERTDENRVSAPPTRSGQVSTVRRSAFSPSSLICLIQGHPSSINLPHSPNCVRRLLWVFVN